MALTNFVASVTKISAAWLNKIDVLYVTVFGEAATKAAARAALTSDLPMALGEGGTGATTAGAARTALGSTTTGDAVFIATSQAVARTALGFSDSGFTTGDVKLTLKTAADSGWVLMDDKTIGNAASGGTGRANADTVALFTLLWTNTVDADCAVSTGRGASAAADYAANKTIALPKSLGRALATYGTGAGLTARTLAKALGEEAHQQVDSEIANNTLSIATSGTSYILGGTGPIVTAYARTGSVPANVMQPTVFLNTMIKL